MLGNPWQGTVHASLFKALGNPSFKKRICLIWETYLTIWKLFFSPPAKHMSNPVDRTFSEMVPLSISLSVMTLSPAPPPLPSRITSPRPLWKGVRTLLLPAP